MENFDFCGWATKNDIKCSDGRTIRKGAFQHQDGKVVPLVWNHEHKDPQNVLGKVVLEHRDEGVYAYGIFNTDTPQGINAKALVTHGDITGLSIYANHLKQKGGDVIHGMIRELSLCYASANPAAYIETVIAHSDDSDEEAIIYAGSINEFSHADNEEEEVEAEAETETPAETEKKENEVEIKHEDSNEKTLGEIVDSMTEEQKDAVAFLVGQAIEDAKNNTEASHADQNGEVLKHTEGDSQEMIHNAFETNTENEGLTLSHAEKDELVHSIFADAPSMGRLSSSILAHAAEYGIDNVEYLFPDFKNVTDKPFLIQRDSEWVQVVLDNVKKTPFAKIRSIFADITADEARAKGYLKGNLKKEEVFGLLKRTTEPTTIYKKQKMNRDDLIDITDMDAAAFLFAEMRVMLHEELARQILIGDGRDALNPDRIDPSKIRPIASDAALYTINRVIPTTSTANDIIDEAIRGRKGYKGSGSPIAFTTEDFLIDARLMRDTHGYRMYKTVSEIADAMGCNKIVTVPVMEGVKGPKGGDLQAVIANLKDYTVGTNKGGEITSFKDFDIDYNQEKYLIETRCSGALTVPYSAMTIETKDGE